MPEQVRFRPVVPDALDARHPREHFGGVVGVRRARARRRQRQIARGPVAERGAGLFSIVGDASVGEPHQRMQRAARDTLNKSSRVAASSAARTEAPDLAREESAVVCLSRAVSERARPGIRRDARHVRRRRDQPLVGAIMLIPMREPIARRAEPIERDENHRRVIGEQIRKLDAVRPSARKDGFQAHGAVSPSTGSPTPRESK